MSPKAISLNVGGQQQGRRRGLVRRRTMFAFYPSSRGKPNGLHHKLWITPSLAKWRFRSLLQPRRRGKNPFSPPLVEESSFNPLANGMRFGGWGFGEVEGLSK